MTDNHHTPETESESQPVSPLDAFVQHQRRAFEEGAKAIESLLPEGFREHSKKAGEEFVAGFKVLIDAAIAEMEKVAKTTEKPASDDDDRPSTTGRTKVKVEVD
jgi:hypothetical protein